MCSNRRCSLTEVLLYSQENLLEGYKDYKKGCEIKLNLLLENLPDLSTTHDSTEKSHQYQQHYIDALNLCEDILKIQLYFLPEDLRSIANTLNRLGTIHKRQRNYDEALKQHTKALHIQLNSLPQNDPDIIRTYWFMGNLLVSVAINNRW